MTGTTAIATHGLTKRFGRVLAVDSLDISVDRGEVYGFLGLNGAGKTTTIRSVLGMVRPTEGSAEVLGTTVGPGVTDVWRRVGYLVEAPTAYPELTVRENLEVVRRLYRVADRQAVPRVIERLSLGGYADRRSRTLSHGNLQRLGIARALLGDPDVLLLDEPANGLDPAGVVEIREMLRDLARERGAAVLMSSHILAEVDRLATRIGIIHEGRLIEELSAEELERRRRRRLLVDARDRTAAARALETAGFAVGTSADGSLQLEETRALEAPDEVARTLVAAGSPPTRLTVEAEDLEEHFLRLTGAETSEGTPAPAEVEPVP